MLVCPDCSEGPDKCECDNGVPLTKSCPHCGGQGQVMDFDISSGTPFIYDCPKCEGRGKL